MDNKFKLKTELKKKLKNEMSTTGTGASVTPGSGEGVATKYAFAKKDNGNKIAKDYIKTFGGKLAPSVPNRPSKAFDYKQLWEAGEYDSLAGVLKQLGAEEDSIKVLIKAVEMGALKPTDAITIVKKALGKKEIKEAKLDIDDRIKVTYGNEFYGETGTIVDIHKGFVTVEMDRDGKEYSMHSSDVQKIEDEDDDYDDEDTLQEAKQEWAVKNIEAMITDYASKKGLNFKLVDKKQQVNQYGSKKTIYIYKLGDKDLIMIDDKAAGAPRLNDFRVGIGTMEPGSSSLKDALSVSKFGSWGVQDIITMLDKAFKSKENINEGYAKFRNETKMRSKPDQFHQAVKQIKRKMNEINRIFEYVDRLKTELSEGEDLKYKKYTENAFQQIKESAKSLFLKSTKLK